MKYIYTLVAVLVLGMIGFVVWALRPQATVQAPQSTTHVLAGVAQPNGDYVYTEDKPYYTIKATYPNNSVVEKWVADAIATFKDQNHLDTLTADDIRIQGLGEDKKYSLELSYVAYTSVATRSYVFTAYDDTLGAHPNSWYKSFVFNVDGIELSLMQALHAAGKAYTLQTIATEARAQIEDQLTKEGVDDVGGTIFAEGFAPTEDNFKNFALNDKELLIFIPPYQVAPYAAGSFEVRL